MSITAATALVPRLLPLALLALLLAAPEAEAHGFIVEPASRNYLRNWGWCPHCVSGGGPAGSSDGGRLQWPATAVPACGAEDLMDAGEQAATWSPGSVAEITVFITAQHGGRHSFRLCPRARASWACFEGEGGYELQRADGKGPYSWVRHTGGRAPGDWGEGYQRGQLIHLAGEYYTWRYRLPKGVACERCVLQWRWTTGNSCEVPRSPRWVSEPHLPRCDSGGTYPEEFINCADVRIGEPPPPPPPRPPKPSRPPPPPAPPPEPPAGGCTYEKAVKFCASKAKQVDRFYAAPGTNCRCWFRCTAGYRPAFGTCKKSLLFNEQAQFCDWPENVKCR